MRILIIGSGGREHSLAWKIKQNPKVSKIFIAPGNGGTAAEGENIAVESSDIPMLIQLITDLKIDFVIPGPEGPLVSGIVDACEKIGVLCFGPKAQPAMLEGSKAFAKTIMREAGVPTANFEIFTEIDKARSYVLERNCPLVIKADGLAAGKGVVVAPDTATALGAIDNMMRYMCFGRAGTKIVIEDLLEGEEASFMVFCQGDTILPLPSCQDHKAAYDDDQGPNTGGMGAYSPAPVLPEDNYTEVIERTIRPVLKNLAAKGIPFSGVLYAGLMMTSSGPKIIEYNVRFGDPECQPMLMRFEGDLLEVLLACAEGRLKDASFGLKKETALCVVIAAAGYPGEYIKGSNISGIPQAEALFPGQIKVFQAGTKIVGENIHASGGRVLGVTSIGTDLADAREKAYAAVECIKMPSSFYRKDIGVKGLRR